MRQADKHCGGMISFGLRIIRVFWLSIFGSTRTHLYIVLCTKTSRSHWPNLIWVSVCDVLASERFSWILIWTMSQKKKHFTGYQADLQQRTLRRERGHIRLEWKVQQETRSPTVCDSVFVSSISGWFLDKFRWAMSQDIHYETGGVVFHWHGNPALCQKDIFNPT